MSRHGRLIDADALKKSVLKWLPPDPCDREEKEYPFETDICVSMIQEIEDAPTIEPQENRWIPVSEKLPKGSEVVWVTIKGHDVIRCEEGETIEQAIERISKIRWVTQAYWSEEEHGWNDPSFGFPLIVHPIAWMPIDRPEPWKGEE